jgi:protein TonB
MLELKPLPPKADRPLLRSSQPELKQQRLMIVALTLLLGALAFVLYRDRDFWFPDAQEAQEQLPQPSSKASSSTSPAPEASPASRKTHARPPHRKNSVAEIVAAPEPATPPEPVTISNRTVLPPLEVEVVAGDNHRMVHPGSNSMRVELQAGSLPPPQVAEPATEDTNTTAASVTSNAAERVQVSADTDDLVARSVRPGYPMLARQMKVEGSVILMALIGRDGLIQDLRVLSGPPILANAAQEAVRQWHFKPHYQGSEAVETQAKITVNFTISTN